jgi:hypothetical protein
MIFRSLLAAAALFFAVPSANAAFDVGDLICETTTTTGTGTVNLAGAVSNYVTFVSQIASGNTVPYHIRASDGKLETGIGTFTDATPDTLTRVADWSTDGSGAELTLPAGTHTVCLGPIASSVVHNPMTEGLDLNNFTLFDSNEAGWSAYNDSKGGVGSGAGFQVEYNNDGTTGAYYVGFHETANPAASDEITSIYADSRDSGGNYTNYGSFSFYIDDPANGSEDSSAYISIARGGTTFSAFGFGFGAMSFVDIDPGATGPTFVIDHDSADPAVNDAVTTILSRGEDSAGNDQDYANIRVEAANVTSTTEASRMEFDVWNAGSAVTNLMIDGSGVKIPPATGQLVVGTTTALATYADGTATPSYQQHGLTLSTSGFSLARWSSTAGAGPSVWLARSFGTTVGDYTIVPDGEALGRFRFEGSTGSDFATAAVILAEVDGTPGASNDMPGRLVFQTSADGSDDVTTRGTIKADGGWIIGNGNVSPGAEDLSLEGGDIEFGNAGTAGTDTTLSYAAAGNLTLEGSRIEKAGTQMIYVPAAAWVGRATSGADCSGTLDSGASDITVRVCNFDTAADEWAMVTISMPPRWNEGTITAQYVWSTTGASTPGETVSIDMSCVAISDDDPLNATLGTPINVDDTMLSADGDVMLSPVSTAVTCGGTPAANDTVVFAVMRDISDDNVAADMSLLGVRIFITTDTANDG